MSAIYFATIDDEAEVRGPDRSLMASLVDQLFVAMLNISDYMSDDDGIWDILRPVDVIPRRFNNGLDYRRDDLRRALGYSGTSSRIRFLIDGIELSAWDLALNTAIAVGDDPMKLCARLHAQCEIFAWVDGQNRKWLADIIRRGRAIDMLRPNLGWESVIDLLEKSDQGPVVTSYSVTESFPDWGLAHEGGYKGDDEAWYKLSDRKRWALAMKALRSQTHSPEMKPETWNSYWFGATDRRYTAFDVTRAAREIEENRPDARVGRIWTKESGAIDEPLSSSANVSTSPPSASS